MELQTFIALEVLELSYMKLIRWFERHITNLPSTLYFYRQTRPLCSCLVKTPSYFLLQACSDWFPNLQGKLIFARPVRVTGTCDDIFECVLICTCIA